MGDLDRIDFELLRLMQNNVRLSNKELASAVGIAASTCHERVKRLWSSGVVRGTHLDLDLAALGYGVQALFLIELAKHERDTIEALFERISQVTEVRAAFLITGRWDLIVHVVAPDMEALKNLAFDHFTCHTEVTRIETSIIYDSRQQNNLLKSQRDHPDEDD